VGIDPDYDVIVVGARVAGSVLALSLAQHGRRVLLLDRASFPSDTLSTHFFRAPALRAFDRVGVLAEVLSVAPKLTVNFNAIDGIVFPEPVDEPEDYPFYLCVRRITLDAILADKVRQQSSIDFRENSRADKLLFKEGRVIGVSWQSKGKQLQATARALVGADGKQSSVAKGVKPAVEKEEAVNRAMYYAYYRGVEPKEGPAAEFHFRGDNLVYCFPCDGELALLAASVHISHFDEFRRDPEGRLDQELHSMTELTARLSRATREGPVRGTGSIPGWLRIPYGEGWALVGDAAMVMDPFSGQGIDQASTHALYLADQLEEFFSGRKDWETAMLSYHQARNEFSLKTFNRTCSNSRDLRPMTRAALETRGIAH
jgi:2-polyprenyl-6-methoxyphenol hydroxylase-like FAD-dependent oxidoreductase